MLGIDPGLVATGYGLLEPLGVSVAVLDFGVIEARAGRPLAERITLIYDGVAALLDKYAPAALVLEDLYMEYRFPRTALLMAHARGVVCLAAGQRGVPVVALAPAEVKRVITGHGGAHKVQIQRGVQRLLALPELPRPSHVADALALAFTGLSRFGGRRRSLSEGAWTAPSETSPQDCAGTARARTWPHRSGGARR